MESETSNPIDESSQTELIIDTDTTIEYIGTELVCDHVFEKDVITPTCETNGEIRYTCSKCNFSYVEKTEKLGHAYQKSIIEPTCTDSGYVEYSCTRCGEKYKTNEQLPLGHKWIDATCTSPKICMVCNTTDGVPLGHMFEDWQTIRKPTVMDPGRERRKCTICHFTETKEIPKLVAQTLNIIFKNEDGDIIPDNSISYSLTCTDYLMQFYEKNGYPVEYFANGMVVDIKTDQSQEYKSATQRIVINGDTDIVFVLPARYTYYQVNPSIYAIDCDLIYIKRNGMYTKLDVSTGGFSDGNWMYTYSAGGTYIGDQFSSELQSGDKCNLSQLYTRIENKDSEFQDSDFIEVSPSINAIKKSEIYYKFDGRYLRMSVSTGGNKDGLWLYTFSADGMYLGDQYANGLNSGDSCYITPLYTKS